MKQLTEEELKALGALSEAYGRIYTEYATELERCQGIKTIDVKPIKQLILDHIKNILNG